jgi:hypothetical protein
MKYYFFLLFFVSLINLYSDSPFPYLELNAEVKYYDNTFEIKNCDDFSWTNVEIGLHSWGYKYGHIIEKIEPYESYLIEFNEFINISGIYGKIGTPFDGVKLKLGTTVPSYLITILTGDRLNGYWLYEEGQIGTSKPINR